MRLSRATIENRASTTHQYGFPAARGVSVHSPIVRPHSDVPNVAERCVWSRLPPSRAACSANTRWRTWTADERQHDSTQPKNRNVTGKVNNEGPRRTAQTPKSEPPLASQSSHHDRRSATKRPSWSPRERRTDNSERHAKQVTEHGEKRYPRAPSQVNRAS